MTDGSIVGDDEVLFVIALHDVECLHHRHWPVGRAWSAVVDMEKALDRGSKGVCIERPVVTLRLGHFHFIRKRKIAMHHGRSQTMYALTLHELKLEFGDSTPVGSR